MRKSLRGSFVAAASTVLVLGGSTVAYAATSNTGTSDGVATCKQEVANGDILADTSHALFAAWDANDGAGVAATFTTDAHMIPLDGSELQGQAAIAAYFTGAFAGPLAHTRMIGKPLSMRCQTRKLVVVDGLGATLFPGDTYTDPSDAPVGQRFIVSWVGQRVGGSWHFFEFQATPQQS